MNKNHSKQTRIMLTSTTSSETLNNTTAEDHSFDHHHLQSNRFVSMNRLIKSDISKLIYSTDIYQLAYRNHSFDYWQELKQLLLDYLEEINSQFLHILNFTTYDVDGFDFVTFEQPDSFEIYCILHSLDYIDDVIQKKFGPRATRLGSSSITTNQAISIYNGDEQNSLLGNQEHSSNYRNVANDNVRHNANSDGSPGSLPHSNMEEKISSIDKKSAGPVTASTDIYSGYQVVSSRGRVIKHAKWLLESKKNKNKNNRSKKNVASVKNQPSTTAVASTLHSILPTSTNVTRVLRNCNQKSEKPNRIKKSNTFVVKPILTFANDCLNCDTAADNQARVDQNNQEMFSNHFHQRIVPRVLFTPIEESPSKLLHNAIDVPGQSSKSITVFNQQEEEPKKTRKRLKEMLYDSGNKMAKTSIMNSSVHSMAQDDSLVKGLIKTASLLKKNTNIPIYDFSSANGGRLQREKRRIKQNRHIATTATTARSISVDEAHNPASAPVVLVESLNDSTVLIPQKPPEVVNDFGILAKLRRNFFDYIWKW